MCDRENEFLDKEIAEKVLKGQEKAQIKHKYAKRKKRYIAISLVVSLGILCYIKFTNFFIENLDSILAKMETGISIPIIDILIPLGISFYTFQSLGYVIDVYRGKIRAEKNIFKMALFVSFFPTITQGPILRFDEVKEELFNNHAFDYKTFTFGLERMLFGYIKKLVIAERLATISSAIINGYVDNNYPGIVIFLGVFLRGLYVYIDFSGGMDIVIGLSEALGIRLTENFERPYLARTYSGFWQRWHISLGAWFKRYVFYPISLSKTFNNLGKKSRKVIGEKKGKAFAPSIASFIVFFLIGIWHGAEWKYVAYGLWQAFFVAQKSLFEDTYERMRNRLHINLKNRAYILFQIIRTVVLVNLGRYFSFANSLSDAMMMLKQTFINPYRGIMNVGYLSTFGISFCDFIILTVFVSVFFIVDILNEKGILVRELLDRSPVAFRWIVLYAGVYIVLILGQYGVGYDASAFVYQGF